MTLTLLTPVKAAGLVAVDKPAGMVVIPGRPGAAEGPCLRDALEQQLGRKVWVVHRIDRDTSGVVVFALDAESHRAASMAFEAGHAKKRYLALVEGRLTSELDIQLPLMEGRKRTMKVAPPGSGKPSRTIVRPVEAFARASVVECEPLTGRQHQLRVHLRAHGHPLLFDHQYGRKQPLTEKDMGGEGSTVVLARTPLHAARLELDGVGVVESPLPADLRRVLDLLRAAPAA